MKKSVLFGILALTLCACLLTACGGADAQKEAEGLRAQVEDLQKQNEALEAERDALLSQLDEQEAQEPADAERDNPIDRFFDTVETDESTIAMNFKEGMRAESWQAEVEAEAERLKEQLPLAEDRATVDAYLAALKEQAARLDLMSFYPCSDISVPQSERLMTAGSILGLMTAGSASRLYRDAYHQLYYVFPASLSGSAQPTDEDFVFDAAAAKATLEDALG